MDIKNWAWKKRSSDKSAGSADAVTPSTPDHSSSFDNGLSKVLGDHVRMSEEAMSRWQQGEEKIRDLNNRLSTALSDATTKEAAVKQHAKVAEEAVAGWEKAEAEAEAMKKQLDIALKDKAVLQDRLSHLDGALKDCTRQVRLVREEQEQKRQELLQRKNKELEKAQAEYEGRLADVGRQVLEAAAENKVMAMTLQDHVRTIGEVTDAKSRAEAEIKVLQHHIESMEKDKAALKYEVHVLNKQIQLRNEEKEYSKRDMNAVNRQHIEDTKKINKLEAECQKLRILVRRKLPGPNALAQMKLEVEGLDNAGERRRGRTTVSPDMVQYKLQQNGNREVELLLERLLTMEEETKLLKEVLAQRNSELHSSRLVCAKAASKLSAMEAYFDSVSRTHGVPKPKLNGLDLDTASSVERASECGATDDEVSCADAWASALIAELSQFKKDKLSKTSPEKALHSPAFSIMDDFADMERLASTIPSERLGDDTPRSDFTSKKHKETPIDEALSAREEEFKDQLSSAEKELSTLKAKNAANESSLISLRRNLDKVFEAQAAGADMKEVMKEAREASELTSELQTAEQEEKQSDHENREVKSLIRKAIFLVEALAGALGMEYSSISPDPSSETKDIKELDARTDADKEQVNSNKRWKNAALESSLQRLGFLNTEIVDCKPGLWEFVNELVGAFDIILSAFTSSEGKLNEEKPQTVERETQTPDVPDEKVELEMLRIEKMALESHMKTELSRLATMERELSQLRNDKANLMNGIDTGTQQVEQLNAQLVEAEKLIDELQVKLSSSDGNKEEAMVVTEVESQVRSSGALMQDVVSRLERELEEEYKNHQAEITMESNHTDEGTAGVALEATAAENEQAARKEQEIAEAGEKLAECQRSILALGKQLKALNSPHQSVDNSLESRADSALSITRVHSESEADGLSDHADSKPRVRSKGGHMREEYTVSPTLSPMMQHSHPGLFYGKQTESGSEGSRGGNGFFSPSQSIEESSPFELTSPSDLSTNTPGVSPGRYMQRRSSASTQLAKTKRSTFSRFFIRTKSSI